MFKWTIWDNYKQEKMRLFFIFLFILTSKIGFAAKDYLIELRGDSLFYKNFGFNIVDIQDKRSNRDNIGYTMKGIFEIKRPINFKNGFVNTLNHYMVNLIHNDTSSTPIKIAIKELFITEEDLSIQQIGNCHLVMEYFDKADKLIYMTDYMSSFSAFDATKKYGDLVKYLIKKSLLTFSLYNSKSNIYFDLLNQHVSYDSILLCPNPKKGFYANFREFQANNPSLMFEFDVIESEEKDNKYANFKLTNPPISANEVFNLIYGFSDGKTIYIKRYISEKLFTFIPIQILGRYCYIGKKYDRQGVPVILPFAIGVVSIPYQQDYIMNISSGKEYPLTDETMKHIFVSDNELYNVYINQPFERREEMGIYWLSEFNKRYIENLKK